jgi:hypothetical protein
MHIGNSVKDQAGLFKVEIIQSSGPVPLYRRPSDGKVFVAGVPGYGFSIRIRNRIGRRLGVICSVDQRDVLTGYPAVLGEPELVLPPYDARTFSSCELDGQTLGDLQFEYPLSETGVIGVAAYQEQLGQRSFARTSSPASVVTIGYATEEWLIDRHILVPAEPEAFIKAAPVPTR